MRRVDIGIVGAGRVKIRRRSDAVEQCFLRLYVRLAQLDSLTPYRMARSGGRTSGKRSKCIASSSAGSRCSGGCKCANGVGPPGYSAAIYAFTRALMGRRSSCPGEETRRSAARRGNDVVASKGLSGRVHTSLEQHTSQQKTYASWYRCSSSTSKSPIETPVDAGMCSVSTTSVESDGDADEVVRDADGEIHKSRVGECRVIRVRWILKQTGARGTRRVPSWR